MSTTNSQVEEVVSPAATTSRMKTAGWSAVLLLLLGLAASLASAQYLASKGEWCGLQGPQRVGLSAALTEQRVRCLG